VSRVNTIYAPDPVFYLHHTQVDRLWWLWQQQDLEARINQYEGPKNNMRIFKNMTQVEASLEDIVEMGGFADDILVRDLMSTQSDLLCYSY
jgi:tyrosinase